MIKLNETKAFAHTTVVLDDLFVHKQEGDLVVPN